MIEYDIYVPMNYNDGDLVEQSKLESIKEDLLAHFKGVSVSSDPVSGYWRSKGRVYHDYNYVYKVVADDSEHTQRVIEDLKAALEESLKQEQIFIIVRNVEVMGC